MIYSLDDAGLRKAQHAGIRGQGGDMNLSEEEKKALVDEYAEMFGAGPLYREGAAEDEGYRLMREASKDGTP